MLSCAHYQPAVSDLTIGTTCVPCVAPSGRISSLLDKDRMGSIAHLCSRHSRMIVGDQTVSILRRTRRRRKQGSHARCTTPVLMPAPTSHRCLLPYLKHTRYSKFRILRSFTATRCIASAGCEKPQQKTTATGK